MTKETKPTKNYRWTCPICEDHNWFSYEVLLIKENVACPACLEVGCVMEGIELEAVKKLTKAEVEKYKEIEDEWVKKNIKKKYARFAKLKLGQAKKLVQHLSEIFHIKPAPTVQYSKIKDDTIEYRNMRVKYFGFYDRDNRAIVFKNKQRPKIENVAHEFAHCICDDYELDTYDVSHNQEFLRILSMVLIYTKDWMVMQRMKQHKHKQKAKS